MVPHLFIYWAFVTTDVVNIHVLNGYFWRGLLTGCLGTMGLGIVMACAIGYVAGTYSLTNNSNCGYTLMTLSWVQPLAVLVYVLMLVAYGSNLNAAVVGACFAVVSAVAWYMLPPSGAVDDQVGMWDQTQRNIVLLPIFMACSAFCM